MLVKWYSTNPFSAARWGMLVPNMAGNISGKRVRISIRSGILHDLTSCQLSVSVGCHAYVLISMLLHRQRQKQTDSRQISTVRKKFFFTSAPRLLPLPLPSSLPSSSPLQELAWASPASAISTPCAPIHSSSTSTIRFLRESPHDPATSGTDPNSLQTACPHLYCEDHSSRALQWPAHRGGSASRSRSGGKTTRSIVPFA